MLSTLLWIVGGYYAFVYFIGVVLLWVGSPMYAKYPWAYYKLLLVPFVGLYMFGSMWLEDLRDYSASCDS